MVTDPLKIISISTVIQSGTWRYGKFSKTKNVFGSVEQYVKILNHRRNLPNGFYSDNCLSKLLRHCHIPGTCFKVERTGIMSYGYSQTHK